MAYVSSHGVGDLSLRQLAAAIGTSHRMLIHHFGSKEGLMYEVVRSVKEAQLDVIRHTAAEDGVDATSQLETLWERVTDEALAPYLHLFFELYAHALQGRPHATALLEGFVDSWTEPMAETRRRDGANVRSARDEARLALAVTRGLVMDLLATGDRAGVERAHRLYVERCQGERSNGR